MIYYKFLRIYSKIHNLDSYGKNKFINAIVYTYYQYYFKLIETIFVENTTLKSKVLKLIKEYDNS